MRTDISEDAKGDPTKIIPQQPVPARADDDDDAPAEPLLPRTAEAGPPPPARKEAQTPADKIGIATSRSK